MSVYIYSLPSSAASKECVGFESFGGISNCCIMNLGRVASLRKSFITDRKVEMTWDSRFYE